MMKEDHAHDDDRQLPVLHSLNFLPTSRYHFPQD